MKRTLVLLFALLSAVPAGASPIIWFDSGTINSVNGSAAFPGLTVGTPWNMQFSFDPDAPGTPGFGSTPSMGCNFYPMGSSVFTLGGFTYTSTGGRVGANSNLPGSPCIGSPVGVIQFEWAVDWTQEPGAWDLNTRGLLIAGYRDGIFRDGELPSVPTPGTFSQGLGYYDAIGGGPPIFFQAFNFTPEALEASPVPEPGTLAMLGAGLAYIARRRVRDSRRPR